MSIREEATNTGATVLRDGSNGQFAPKPPSPEATTVSLNNNGFGMPAPQFVLRGQDENPVPFDESFRAKHGNRIASAMEKLPRDRPSLVMQDLLEDIRCGYPSFYETASKGDYEVAVENLREELKPIPEVERERYIELITFGVQAEMDHYMDLQHYENIPGWADVTYQNEQDEPVEPILATDINRDAWQALTDHAAAAAGKARLGL